jgi:protein TonB
MRGALRRLWPKDRSQRALVLGIAGSVLFHVLLVVLVILAGVSGQAPYVKRGEPLMVDITPGKPEERAPLGDPSRRVQPEAAPAPAARPTPPPTPPAPRATPAPRPTPPAPRTAEAPRPTPPAPLAKAEEPAPTAAARAPERPEAAPAQPSATPAPSEPRVALARPQLDTPPSIFRRPGGGGGLRGGGRGGTEGEPIPLDTPEPKYQDYFNKIRQRIKEKWIYPREAGDRGIGGQLLIEFHIAKNGDLAYLELRRPSGVEILDEYAMNAVRLAAPFPPVPDQLAKAVLPISGVFRYEISSSFVNQFIK